MSRVTARHRCALAAVAGAVAMAGCGGEQSTLDPRAEPARDVETLWWWMLVVASIVFLGAVVMLLIGWLRRSPGLPFVGESERVNQGLVIVFGFVIPLGVLIALFVVSNLSVMDATSAPEEETTEMTIEVTGHQWFWEVRYPGTGGEEEVVTANDIHIPTKTRVNLVATTGDVIHSFWVPQLNRKIDMIPGRENRILLYADEPGEYRGQCAELCGLQHAHMSKKVIAEPREEFDRWLAEQRRPRREPESPLAREGESVFLESQCASCHTIKGTEARGEVGPDLTHFASRESIAAHTLANTPENLRRWLEDPQDVKPGNKMPDLGLSPGQLDALVAYLEGLR